MQLENDDFSIGFLAFSFCFSWTSMHHFYYRDWEGKCTYLVLERWRRWWCWPLLLSVFSTSPFGLFFSLPLLFCSSPCSALLRVSLFFFSCISLCIISFLSSSLPYALPLSVFLWLYSRINAIHVSNVLHRGSWG